MAEADLVRKWMAQLRNLGAWAERHSAFELQSGRGTERLGLPDIEVCFRERFLAIEAKKNIKEWRDWYLDRSDQSPTQKQCLKEVRAAGGIDICTFTFDDIDIAVRMILADARSEAINEVIDERQQTYLEKTTRCPRVTSSIKSKRVQRTSDSKA